VLVEIVIVLWGCVVLVKVTVWTPEAMVATREAVLAALKTAVEMVFPRLVLGLVVDSPEVVSTRFYAVSNITDVMEDG
jgi:hypothetical protein